MVRDGWVWIHDGVCMLDIGYWMWNTGYWTGYYGVDTGYWILDSGYWTWWTGYYGVDWRLGWTHWMLDWILDPMQTGWILYCIVQDSQYSTSTSTSTIQYSTGQYLVTIKQVALKG